MFSSSMMEVTIEKNEQLMVWPNCYVFIANPEWDTSDPSTQYYMKARLKEGTQMILLEDASFEVEKFLLENEADNELVYV